MKKFYILGQVMAVIGAILGFASILGVIGFVGGYERNDDPRSLVLAIACLCVMGVVVVIAKFLPELLKELEVCAMELAEEAKLQCQKKRYIRFRKIASCAHALKQGLSIIE